MIEFTLIFSLFIIVLLLIYTYQRFSRGWSLKVLFKDFNRKMWMTVFLGGIFFGIYVLVVILTTYFIAPWGSNIFFLAYKYPIEFIYGGLALFAFFSLSIYLARMLIKYLYLTRGKDNH